MSPEISRQIRADTQQLLDAGFSEPEFNRTIADTYRKYPTSNHMRRLPPRTDVLGAP